MQQRNDDSPGIGQAIAVSYLPCSIFITTTTTTTTTTIIFIFIFIFIILFTTTKLDCFSRKCKWHSP